MKIVASIFFLQLIVFNALCQDIKQIFKRFDHSKQISESYYVLRSNKDIKHGKYVSYFKLAQGEGDMVKKGLSSINDYIKDIGFYNQGKKDGIWIERSSPKKKDSGYYSNGEKIGVWSKFIEDIKVSSYNYDTKKKCGIWITMKDSNTVQERFDFDKNKLIDPIIKLNIHYPQKAREENIQGVVKVKYHVNGDCTTDNFTVIISLSPECDAELIRAIKRRSELYKKYGVNCDPKDEELEIKYTMAD